MDWSLFPALFAAGCLAGGLNVVAGGGSFLTLPLLIFCGLPAGVANGTNRVAIVVQNTAAVWSFRRHGIFEPGDFRRAALPAIPGGILGAGLAPVIPDDDFQRLLAVLMVVLSFLSLAKAGSAPPSTPDASGAPAQSATVFGAGFFLAGVYSGFVQAGVGFLFLAVTTAAGLDLVRGNALKVLAILALSVFAIGVFAWNGRVDWLPGLVLAAGNFLGGLVGVQLTVKRGHAWIRRVVTVMVVVFAVKLWLDA